MLEAYERNGALIPLILFDNPYGFRLNVYHPKIAPIYERFKAKRGISPIFPVDDADRREFEAIMLEYLYKKLGPGFRPEEGGQKNSA